MRILPAVDWWRTMVCGLPPALINRRAYPAAGCDCWSYLLPLRARSGYMQNLSKHAGGTVRAFPSEQWTLEFDLARQPPLASLVHQAVQLGKGRANRTRVQIIEDARAEVEAWQADDGKTADDIAVLIFTPLHKKQVSKAVVAEQLAALIEEVPDDAAAFRAKLPAYLVTAIDYVTETLHDAADGEQAAVTDAIPPLA